MARPTKLTEELVAKAGEYLDTCEDKFTVVGEGKATTVIQEVNLPTIEGLALHLGLHRDTIYEWEKVPEAEALVPDELTETAIGEAAEQYRLREEFSDIVTRVRQEQAKRLINKGLGGQYNPQIGKTLLSKHGYSEKTEIDHTSKGEQLQAPAAVEAGVLDQFVARLKDATKQG
jgi:hypothetical protein